MKKVFGILAVVALLSACGSGRVVAANTLYDDGDQPSSDCGADAPINGTPGDNAGDFCDNAVTDCLEACCQCQGDDNTFWVSECYHGYCATGNDACTDACQIRAQQ